MMIGSFSPQSMYDKIDTLADKPEKIVTKMNTQNAQFQKEDDSEVAARFSNLQTKRERCKQSRKLRKTHPSGNESEGHSSEHKKHHRRSWRDTQECYRCHKVGHFEQYYPSSALLESGAPTERAAAEVAGAMTMTTTSIENYWMTVTTREGPSKESWYRDCATTSLICGDQ
jgi:hypothetical protein